VNLVEAQVVTASLQQREIGAAGQCGGQCVGEPREVAIDELALQRNGGRRHDDRLMRGDGPRDRGHQVGE
jgi:hypothetical protein